jgi:hypothetical protein
MVLTNAQRQERYRKRLKARASGADLAEQAREAVDAAFAACWAIFSRPSASGADWAGLEGFADVASWQASFGREQPATVLGMFDEWLQDEETEISDAEREAIERGAGVYRAVLLAHVAGAEKPKRKRRS